MKIGIPNISLLGPISGTTFLWIAGGASALVISAYIIKMRRRRFEVPFSQLWRRVLEQKDANALWKQLKRLMSLLLILFILGMVLFAALDPTVGAVNRSARSVVILIDASASMKAMDGNKAGTMSRIEAAKNRADALIDSMGGGDVAMVMKVDGQATPLSRFSSDAPMLHNIVHGNDAVTGAAKLTTEQAKKLIAVRCRGEADVAKCESMFTGAALEELVNQSNEARAAKPDLGPTGTLGGITASDTPADLTRALGAAADALRDRPNPLIVLISDGAFPEAQLGLVNWAPQINLGTGSGSAGAKIVKDLASVDLTNIDVRYLAVGARSDNVGIVSFNVRRYIANKAAYEVYIEVQNFGQEPATRNLALYNGDNMVEVKQIDLKAGERKKKIYAKLPASEDNRLRASLRPIAEAPAGVSGSDAFALDDTAYALLPPQKKQKVLMVTEDNLFLEGALLVYDNIDPLKVTPKEYDDKPALADGMDVVIFDEHTPEVIPPSPTSLLYFHPTGPKSPIAIRETQAKDPHITEIDEQHPVMKWVTMSDVFMDKSAVFLPNAKLGESTIAFSVTDSIIAIKREGRRKILAFGFSLPATGRESATDLPMRVAFPMLLVNALDWFAGDQTDLLTTYSTGRRERVPLDGVLGATEAEVKGPDGTVTKTPMIDGLATFYGARVGYYDLTAKDTNGKTVGQIELAANLASPTESDIAPSTKLTLGGKQLTEPESFAVTHSEKWWTTIILIALGLIVLEWITYHRRITV